MRTEDIHTGAAYTMKVGRNTIEVTVTGTTDNGGWLVETRTGRTMTVRNADRFIAQVGAPETPATAADDAQADRTPDASAERDTGRGMSLLAAAAHLLADADEPMRCQDLVEQAREQGLWAPKRGGKTPDRTLYAAILREIHTKGDDARFTKVDRGRFALRTEA